MNAVGLAINSEHWLFPVFGPLTLFFFWLPLAAILTSPLLSKLEHSSSVAFLHSLDLKFAILISASLIPLIWFVSAAIHQVEPGALLSCCLGHKTDSSPCTESVFFLANLSAIIAFALLSTGYSTWRRTKTDNLAPGLRHDRVRSIVRSNQTLESVSHQIFTCDASDASPTIATVGLLKPRILITNDFIESNRNEVIRAALLHEVMHVRSSDALRYLFLKLSLRLNPVGAWFLKSYIDKWINAREIHCDRDAVIHGASPLALAEAILFAARTTSTRHAHPWAAAPLVGNQLEALKFRVELLVAYHESPPSLCSSCRSLKKPLLLVATLMLVLLPHLQGMSPHTYTHDFLSNAFTTIRI